MMTFMASKVFLYTAYFLFNIKSIFIWKIKKYSILSKLRGEWPHRWADNNLIEIIHSGALSPFLQQLNIFNLPVLLKEIL